MLGGSVLNILLTTKSVEVETGKSGKAVLELSPEIIQNQEVISVKLLEKALEKLTNEESRAYQAFTGGYSDFEKFKATSGGIKAKKELLQSQVQRLEDVVPGEDVNLDGFDDVCESLYYRMKHSTDYQKKRNIIKNLIISIYVGERRKALVNGQIPLMTQGQNIQDVLISWNSLSGIKFLVNPDSMKTPKVPYEFIINLPKPRYERNITKRDEMGRIVHSKPPQSPV